MNQKQTAFTKTTERSLATLGKIRLRKSLNPFSRRGGLFPRLFRDEYAVLYERMGDKLLTVNPSDALKLFSKAHEAEKNLFFQSVLLLKAAEAALRSASSAEYAYASSLRLLKGAARWVSGAAYRLDRYDARISATLHALSGEIFSIMSDKYSSGEFSAAACLSECPRMRAAYMERAADFAFPGDGAKTALELYAAALESLENSRVSSESAKSRIYRKMAECAFSMGDWDAAKDFLEDGGTDSVVSKYEKEGRRALAEGDYRSAVILMSAAICQELTLDDARWELAFRFARLLKQASAMASGPEGAEAAAFLRDMAAEFLGIAAGEEPNSDFGRIP